MRRFFTDRRFLAILFLGIASGLPSALIGGTLTFWLAKYGASKATIGLFRLVGLPYTLKFLWAPFLDQIRLGGWARRLGRRRSWGLVIQVLLFVSILALGATNPEHDLRSVAILALVVGILSASQDIVIDAFRVELLDLSEQGIGAATIVFGWRLGFLASGAGTLFLSSVYGWHAAYQLTAALLVFGVIGLLLVAEPIAIVQTTRPFRLWVNDSIVAPLRDFLSRERAFVIVLFILLYKLADMLLLAMTSKFYSDLGFTAVDIASISKIFGVVAMIAGGFAGGFIVKQAGIWRALLITGILQAIGNYGFAFLALAGHDRTILACAVGTEAFTAAMSTAAFVAYLSSLCNLKFTATQYALFSALAGFARDVLPASSGFLAERQGWLTYFSVVPLAAIPGLVLLFFLPRPGKYP